VTALDNILVYDYETTGISPQSDRPVQIGVCDGGERVVINTFCNPCMEIPEGAAEVHGITQAQVQGFPDYLMALWAQIRVFSGYSDPLLVGFNTSTYDGPMLEACLGYPVLSQYRQLDLLDVIYRYYPTLEHKKLTELHQHFLKQELTGAHGAIQDCIGTARVLLWVCRDLEKSVDDLQAELAVPKPYSVMPIGKHRGKPISQVPSSWARWMLNNATDMRPDLQLTVEAIVKQ
jgi:DNA polymerase III epsilon subunit-like protein